MTERKFTPPTEFPAEYVNGFGDKITLLAKGVGECPYTGQHANGNWYSYCADGSFSAHGSHSNLDLHDLPQKQVHWANDYEYCSDGSWYESREDADKKAIGWRFAVIRREWVEGELPQYFVEEV